ncbi:MAG: hypothetical protein JSU00_15875 [Acidobacteria bacterium]|nr:hypothetical protein [Acidobacteriota bacterium]
MDYMTEIAAAALPHLLSDPVVSPVVESTTEEIEAALKTEMGWSRFLDIWRDGATQARCDLLTDLLYRRPSIAVTLVRTLLGGEYPSLLIQLARRIRAAAPDAALDLYRNLPDEDLLHTLLLSPERVLMLSEILSVPVPFVTAEHVLWSAAQNANSTDSTKLQFLMSRLSHLKERLEVVGLSIERCADPAVRRGYTAYRNAVDREVEQTEASMRRLEQLLAGLRAAPSKPARAKRSAFRVVCRPRIAALRA